MSDRAPDPDKLRALGDRLDEAERRRAVRANQAPPTSMAIAFRFTTEMVAALVVGGALGWGLDWLAGRIGFHTRPLFLVVMFVLGAGAGIRNVLRAAKEINARLSAPADKGK